MRTPEARAAQAGQTQAFAPASVREFAYDDAGRIKQVKRDGVVAMNYLYNARGEHVYRSGSGQTVHTVYDEGGHWLGDYDAAGNALQQAIWLDDLPVGLLVGAGANQTLYYLEPDALGSPRVAIDPDRDVAVWRWDLTGEAFGNSAPNEDPDADGIAFTLDMRFPGQRYDAATELNYNYFRDYDPTTGRYAQSDPIGLEGGISTYGYAGGNPLMQFDSYGLRPGDCYKTADIAAANALVDVLYPSITQNREYGGWIYITANGWYSYTAPQKGGEGGISLWDEPANSVGRYHTHGGNDPNYDSENFSSRDINLKFGETAYLGTPSWTLKKYTNNSSSDPLKILPMPADNNEDACSCEKRNDYEDFWKTLWRNIFE